MQILTPNCKPQFLLEIHNYFQNYRSSQTIASMHRLGEHESSLNPTKQMHILAI